MEPVDPNKLFITLAQMRDNIETILKRGKPATKEELEQVREQLRGDAQQIPQQVREQGEQLLNQARKGYSYTLNSEKIAELLVPHMPTNTETGRIMHEATARMQQTMATGTQAMVAQVQQVQAIQTSLPREVLVKGEVYGFTNWKSAIGTAVIPAVVLLLTLWYMGKLSGIPREEVALLVTRMQNDSTIVSRHLTIFEDNRARLLKERPELAHEYFPYRNEKKPVKEKMLQKKSVAKKRR